MMIRLHTQNFRSPVALGLFVLTTLVGLGLDLWTKDYAFAQLAYYTPDGRFATHVHPLIPGYLQFEVTQNRGAVFGMGAGYRGLFIAVSVAAIVFLTLLFANSGKQRFYQFILGMLLAGVLGNMYDRIRFGMVRDMIHALPQWPRLFPYIFNVADVLLCTGVGLMFIYSIVHGKEQERSAALPNEPGEPRATRP
jgi:signal peptidase II